VENLKHEHAKELEKLEKCHSAKELSLRKKLAAMTATQRVAMDVGGVAEDVDYPSVCTRHFWIPAI
jgi:hypothetical protein